MKLVVLHPMKLWILSILPAIYYWDRKFNRSCSIVVPNVQLLKKILGGNSFVRRDNMIYFRLFSIALLIISCSDIMIIRLQSIIRCDYYIIIVSLGSFLIEMFLKNIIFSKLP